MLDHEEDYSVSLLGQLPLVSLAKLLPGLAPKYSEGGLTIRGAINAINHRKSRLSSSDAEL